MKDSAFRGSCCQAWKALLTVLQLHTRIESSEQSAPKLPDLLPCSYHRDHSPSVHMHLRSARYAVAFRVGHFVIENVMCSPPSLTENGMQVASGPSRCFVRDCSHTGAAAAPFTAAAGRQELACCFCAENHSRRSPSERLPDDYFHIPSDLHGCKLSAGSMSPAVPAVHANCDAVSLPLI